MTPRVRIALMFATLLGAAGLGYLSVTTPTYALVGVVAIVFVLLWNTAPGMVLLAPLGWIVLGDPALLRVTGLSAASWLFNGIDVWTAVCVLTALLYLASNVSGRQAMAEPASLGILALWLAVAVSTVLGGNALPARALWIAEVRGLVSVGWYFVVLAVSLRRGHRGVILAAYAITLVLVLKGILYWVSGIGVLSATYAAGYRAFGSEEATVGLISLLVGIAGLSLTRERWGMWPIALTAAGGMLVLFSTLRVFWVGSIVAVGVMLLTDLASREGGQVRRFAILGGALGLVVALFATVGRSFFASSISVRLGSLVGGVQSILGDQSLDYRVIEWGAVPSAVGARWLFGAGLGASHRGFFFWPTDDPFLQASLPTYVHNTFLWIYLKAGITGVVGASSLFLGAFLSAFRSSRLGKLTIGSVLGRGMLYAIPVLVFAGLFNAHVASARYMEVLGLASGCMVAAGLDAPTRGKEADPT